VASAPTAGGRTKPAHVSAPAESIGVRGLGKFRACRMLSNDLSLVIESIRKTFGRRDERVKPWLYSAFSAISSHGEPPANMAVMSGGEAVRMASGWLNQIPSVDGGKIRVHQRPADVVDGSVDMGAPRTLVWHTTEGDGVPPYADGVAPHFTAPDDELVVYQHVQLGKIGTSLRHEGAPETNRIAVIQVEQSDTPRPLRGCPRRSRSRS
jgi:hypothetical protein